MKEGATLINAVVGAVVSVAGSSVVPFASVLGGAVAGYLEGGSRSDGVRVGFISGVIAFVPGTFVVLLVAGLFGSLLLGMGPGTDGIAVGVFGLWFFGLAVLVGFVVVVSLSTFGGWVGNYIKHDTDIDV